MLFYSTILILLLNLCKIYRTPILHECAASVNRKWLFGKIFEPFCDKLELVFAVYFEIALDYLVAHFNRQHVKAFADLAVFKKEISHFIKASFNSIFAPPRADIH